MKVIVLGTADALNSKISEMIRNGWQPYGQPNGWHHQAMVMYEESAK
jgi:hypothetical protein